MKIMNKFTLSKIKIKNIHGESVPLKSVKKEGEKYIEIDTTVDKEIGNVVYANAKTIELGDIAKDIHAGKEVALSKAHVSEIKDIINSDKFPYSQMVKRQIIEYIDTNNK